jgi:hypothetical protein
MNVEPSAANVTLHYHFLHNDSDGAVMKYSTFDSESHIGRAVQECFPKL